MRCKDFEKGCCVCDHKAWNHQSIKYFYLAGALGNRIEIVGDEADELHRAL